MNINQNIRRGKKSIQLRQYNERRVLQALRRMGSASKAQIARYVNLTNAAMGGIIDSLEEKGLVYYGEKEHKGGKGQPATMIHLNGSGVYSIGVQLDRNKIDTILIDFDGNIISRITHEKILPRPEQTLQIVKDDIKKSLNILNSEQKKRLAGVGLAIPFNLDCWTDELNLPEDEFSYWKDYDFSKELEEEIKIPVYKENDGTSATIAALYYGVGREINGFLYLYIGPGIGGGLVLNGEIVRGERGNAADVGSMPVPHSRLESSAKPKTMFDIMLNRASLNVLIRHLKYKGIKVDSQAELEAIIASQNEFFNEWLEDSVEALSHLIWSSITLLDISTIVVASAVDGGLPAKIKEKLDESLKRNSPKTFVIPKVVKGKFASDAGAIGAASLPIFYSFSPTTEILTEGLNNEFK